MSDPTLFDYVKPQFWFMSMKTCICVRPNLNIIRWFGLLPVEGCLHLLAINRIKLTLHSPWDSHLRYFCRELKSYWYILSASLPTAPSWYFTSATLQFAAIRNCTFLRFTIFQNSLMFAQSLFFLWQVCWALCCRPLDLWNGLHKIIHLAEWFVAWLNCKLLVGCSW